jgi:hypothetical protein
LLFGRSAADGNQKNDKEKFVHFETVNGKVMV